MNTDELDRLQALADEYEAMCADPMPGSPHELEEAAGKVASAVPELIAEVRRLREELAKESALREAVDKWIDCECPCTCEQEDDVCVMCHHYTPILQAMGIFPMPAETA